jgi:hypothetical protein
MVFDGKDIILLGIFGGLTIAFLIITIVMRSKMKKMLKGTKAVTIEESIMEIVKDLKELEDFRDNSIELFKKYNSRINSSIRAIETSRYNAFPGMGSGGNQSFTSVFSDERGNGLIITGLYSSESMRVFAKPMSEFDSQFELTEEEINTVKSAKSKLGK